MPNITQVAEAFSIRGVAPAGGPSFLPWSYLTQPIRRWSRWQSSPCSDFWMDPEWTPGAVHRDPAIAFR
jgi:hypothetical protein